MDDTALLNSIINDDLLEFERLLRAVGNYGYSFGRFPLLSLCYMYEAGSIIRIHEGDMLKYSEYVVLDEPIKIYEDFKVIAQKCLRFYISGKTVTPCEMLALLGRSAHIKKIWGFVPKDEKYCELIAKIYQLRFGLDATVTPTELILPNIKLKNKNKNLIRVFALGGFVATVSILTLLLVFIFVIGYGSQHHPLRINSANAFYKQVNAVSYILLTKDMAFTQGLDEIGEVVIDGNGKTITLNDDFLAKDFKGELKNVNIVIDKNGAITQDVALFINNQGNIHDVTLTIRSNFSENTTQDNLYLSGFAVNNTGSVTDSSVYLSVSGNSNGEGNAYFSGAVAINDGRIENVNVYGEGIFDTVDAAGLCVENNASIINCVNNAYVKQTSSYISPEPYENGRYGIWNPNAAGVVLTNGISGRVENCSNLGKVEVISDVKIPLGENNERLASAEAFSGGITAVNLGIITKCKNLGDITLSAVDAYAYLGGIAACNTVQQVSLFMTYRGSISESYSKCKLISSSTVNLTIVGGVVGYDRGGVAYSYADCDFEYSENSNQAIGGVIGMDFCDVAVNVALLYNSNVAHNYSIKKETAKYAIGAISYENYMGMTQNTLVDDTYLLTDSDGRNYLGQGNYALDTIDELKETGVYWE